MNISPNIYLFFSIWLHEMVYISKKWSAQVHDGMRGARAEKEAQ